MPAKPKAKAVAETPPKPEIVQQQAVESALQVSQIPDWVNFDPLADYRLVAWDSDEKTVEVLLTSYEYAVLKNHLARIRGYALMEAAHA